MHPLIIGNGHRETRVLRPWEFQALHDAIPHKTPEQQLNLKVALLTGMRYAELRDFQDHPEWWDGHYIYLQEKKVMRPFKHRYVRVNSLAKNLIPLFHKNKELPRVEIWNRNLKRWARRARIGTRGINTKTTRKTWESWLVSTYPDKMPHIVQSQGHTDVTSIQYYLNLAFTDEDLKG